MPVALLSEMEARRWGRFGGEPSIEQLDRFFHLDPEDLRHARHRRGDAAVLGFAVQVGTLRFLGTLLAQIDDTPRGVVASSRTHLRLHRPCRFHCHDGGDER